MTITIYWLKSPSRTCQCKALGSFSRRKRWNRIADCRCFLSSLRSDGVRNIPECRSASPSDWAFSFARTLLCYLIGPVTRAFGLGRNLFLPQQSRRDLRLPLHMPVSLNVARKKTQSRSS